MLSSPRAPRPLHSRKAHSSPTIRNIPRVLDHKPLPLLPYMIPVSKRPRINEEPKRSRSSPSPKRQMNSDEYRDVVEGYLYVVGQQWQGYLGDPNPYRNAREWEREGRKMKPLYELVWEEEEYRGKAESGWNGNSF